MQTNNSFFRAILLAGLIGLTACGNDDDGPEPGPDDLMSNIPAISNTVTAGNDVYSVGYDQVSSINQDAWVRKVSNGTQVYKTMLGTADPDERGDKVYRDPATGDIWVVLTVDGGSNNAGYITNRAAAGAFSNVPFPTYGQGGGPRVSVLARIDPNTGQIVKGTYLRSRLASNGNTNSLQVQTIRVVNGNVQVDANSASFPPAAGSTASNFTQHPDAVDANRINNAFRVRMELPRDLSRLARVEIIKP